MSNLKFISRSGTLFSIARYALIYLFILGGSSLFAQDFLPVQLGIKGGVPIWGQLITTNNAAGGYNSAIRRWIVGPTAEFKLFGPFHLEVDALYRRVGFDFNGPDAFGPGTQFRPTVGNWWEFPALLKTHFSSSHYRPFVDFGASLRHISSIRQTVYTANYFAPIISDNSSVLHNRNSPGAVAGAGLTYAVKKFRLTPEVRYTRWFNQAFADDARLRTNLNQIDFLLGVNF
jgi:hypothetical protein